MTRRRYYELYAPTVWLHDRDDYRRLLVRTLKDWIRYCQSVRADRITAWGSRARPLP